MGSFRPKKQSSCGPFLIGLIIGIALSIGLRYLSNPCWRRVLTYENFVFATETVARSNTNEDSYIHSLKNDRLSANDNNNANENQLLQQQQQQLLDSYDEKVILPSNNKYLPQPQDQDQIESLDELLPVINMPDVDKVDNFLASSSSSTVVVPSKKSHWKTSQKNLLLVGVMTAEKYLDNRAVGVFETWAQNIPGKVIFFTGADSSTKTDYENRSSNFTLVPLKDVDDSYPPQKKSFKMLKYMYDNYGDDYEWFMRADDDVYVKADKLSEFLRSINSKQLYFIGQAGKGNGAEKGTLNLAHNENFCMGGPGVILSRVALAKVAPYVEHCLQEMYSTHEDVEIGRCVQRFVGISCTWAYEMQSIFYHNSSGENAFTDNLKRREVHRAITLHPVKNFQHMYRLHSYVQGLTVQDLIYESLLIQRELLALPPTVSSYSESKSKSGPDKRQLGNLTTLEPEDVNIYGLPPSLNRFKPDIEKDIIGWSFLGNGAIYSDSSFTPKAKIENSLKEALEDVIREMMEMINGYSRVRGRIIDFKEILYGYHRVNPIYGQDFILDLLMTYKKYRGKKMTVPVRRHAYIQRSFSPLHLRLNPHSDSDTDYNSLNTNHQSSSSKSQGKNQNKDISEPIKFVMILPLSGRTTAFERFLQSYQNTCEDWRRMKMDVQTQAGSMKSSFSLNLIISYFDSPDDGEEGRRLFFSLVNAARLRLNPSANSSSKDQFERNTLSSCNIEVFLSKELSFSRSIALETGISRCNDNDLLFLIDVDIQFNIEALRRVIHNTVQGRQVYFPIVFSQYNPNLSLNPEKRDNAKNDNNNLSYNPDSDTEISDDTGYWRNYGFGIAAFFKSDYILAGGFDTSIKGWGKEDVSLYTQFITNTSLTIFRAPDPQLIHIYHDFRCDPENLARSQYTMCLGSQANSLGSWKNLMKYFFQRRPGSVTGHIKRFLEQAAASITMSSSASPAV